jgi:hypothetical protein
MHSSHACNIGRLGAASKSLTKGDVQMSGFAELVEFLAQRPDMIIALCVVAVVALVLAERAIRPTEVSEG